MNPNPLLRPAGRRAPRRASSAIVVSVLAGALATGACQRSAVIKDPPPPKPQALTKALATDTIVAELPVGASCPTSLSVPTTKSKYEGRLLLSSKRGTYCVFVSPTPVRPGDAAALAKELGPDVLAEADLPVVAPLQTADSEGCHPAQYMDAASQHDSQLKPERLVEAMERGIGLQYLPPSGTIPVKVSVIDTAEKPTEAPPNVDCSQHGRTVGLVIRELACGRDAPSCAVDVSYHLGLPVRNPEQPNPADGRGGHIGKRSDLVAAIMRAAEGTDAKSRHIVNLSVGWHSDHNAFTDEEWILGRKPGDGRSVPPLKDGSLHVRTVYEALAYARCKGALVVAAAGNAHGIDRYGPLYPAAWASEKADCGGSVAAPLVYAVSAVDHTGTLLDNTREPNALGRGGTAVRAALGLSVTALDPNVREYRLPLTGTSMATAVLSGIAARWWSMQEKSASAEEVMQHLDQSLVAPPTDRAPNLSYEGNTRASYGVLRACEVFGVPCGAMARPGASASLQPSTPPATPQQSADTVYVSPVLEPWVVPQPAPPVCSAVCTSTWREGKLITELRFSSDVVPRNLRARFDSGETLDLGQATHGTNLHLIVSAPRSVTLRLETRQNGRTSGYDHVLTLLD